MRHILLLVILSIVSGCCTKTLKNEGEATSVSKVVKQIKDDLKAYQLYDAAAASATPLNTKCGLVSFSISSIDLSLTTQTDNSVSGSIGATLPVGGGTFGPEGSKSTQVKGTQTVSISLYPHEESFNQSEKATVPAEIDPEKFPIAAGLQKLRDGLMQASQHEPCVSLIPTSENGKPVKDEGATLIFGFTVVNKTTSQAGLKFVLFSLGTTSTSQRQAANTITVHFKARPGAGQTLYSN